MGFVPQFIPKQLKGICLSPHLVKILDTVAIASDVAVNAAVTAATVQVHIVVRAKPARGFVFVKYRPCFNAFHRTPSPVKQFFLFLLYQFFKVPVNRPSIFAEKIFNKISSVFLLTNTPKYDNIS